VAFGPCGFDPRPRHSELLGSLSVGLATEVFWIETLLSESGTSEMSNVRALPGTFVARPCAKSEHGQSANFRIRANP
jgi:hypothetical protein